MKLRPVLLIGAMALALGACGKRGTLERPPPMWGKDKAAAQSDKDKDDKDAAKHAQVQRSGDRKPPTPESQNVSIQAQPVETGKSDPVGGSPVEPH